MTKSNRPDCFFITGTGRCGTMLLARLFSQATDAICEHEQCFRHQSMVACCADGDMTGYERDIQQTLLPRIEHHAQEGRLYGVSSGHCYLAVLRLHELLQDRARFVLMVRRPEEFVRSALARGFFDTDHPNTCEQTLPPPRDPIAARWNQASPLEKCLWYWQFVNGKTLAALEQLPTDRWRVLRMEDLNPSTVCDLRDFLGIRGLGDEAVRQGLAHGVNVSPGSGRPGEANPYSQPIRLPPLETWSQSDRDLLERYGEPLRSQWYAAEALTA